MHREKNNTSVPYSFPLFLPCDRAVKRANFRAPPGSCTETFLGLPLTETHAMVAATREHGGPLGVRFCVSLVTQRNS